MTKIKLTQEQADAVKSIKLVSAESRTVEDYINNSLTRPKYVCLKNLSLDELCQALYSSKSEH